MNDEIRRWPHDDRGSSDHDEIPDIPSDERGGNVERIDEELAEAGSLPTDLGAGGLEPEELMRRMRARANKELRDDAELPEKSQAKIKKFLQTIKVPQAEEVTPQEIELIWKRMNENHTMIRDLIYTLITRDSNNHHSLYPMIPKMPEVMEFVAAIPPSNPERPEESEVAKLRPMIINQGKNNLARIFHIDKAKVTSIASGTRGRRLAEEMRLVGWLAGFEFVRAKAAQTVNEQMRIMDIEQTTDNLTPALLGAAFYIIVDKEIDTLLSQRKNYTMQYHMDERGLEIHENIIQALQGIRDLLYDTFLDSPDTDPESFLGLG